MKEETKPTIHLDTNGYEIPESLYNRHMGILGFLDDELKSTYKPFIGLFADSDPIMLQVSIDLKSLTAAVKDLVEELRKSNGSYNDGGKGENNV